MRSRVMLAATAAAVGVLFVAPATSGATQQPDCYTYAGAVTVCRSDLPQPVTDPVGFLRGEEAALCEENPGVCTT